MCQAVRVKFTNGSEILSDKFRDLYVRSKVVIAMAWIYIERHIDVLQDRKGVLEIHAREKCTTVAESLKLHVEKRVNELYPEIQFGTEEGALLPGIKAVAEALQHDRCPAQREESGFDMKQSTMHDESRSVEGTFNNMRPSIVVDEAVTAGAFAPEIVNAQAVESVVDVEVPISNVLEEQFVGHYMSSIFPYALNHACGGADWPELFGDWEALTEGDAAQREGLLKPRFRRSAEDPVVTPAAFAQMMATRPEVQVAGDWMVVPSAAQLDWRYKVLRSSFMTCRQRLAPGESLHQNLADLINAVEKVWKRIQKNTVTLKTADGELVKRPINGDVRVLFNAVDITPAEKTILKSYLSTTSNIAGCQAIRQKIGHACFGFRVVHGEVIFVTVSPNRRHSSMILKLSRARRNDTSLEADDDVTRCRKRHCGRQTPSIFSEYSVVDDSTGQQTMREIPLPDIFDRQAWNAQDPLSSCYHYLFFMYTILPALFGIRMCMRCPDCNVDRTDPRNENDVTVSCQDFMGSNMKSMGGYAGLATGMAFATEYQGEATPHGHGFVSLANMYQHHNLEQIGDMIERNSKGMTPEDMLDRVKSFVNHVQREDHMDNEKHQKNLRKFEADFHTNNAGPDENVHLSVRPARFYSCSSSPCAWDPQNRTRSADGDEKDCISAKFWDKVGEDAAEFERQYTADVQFIRTASPRPAEATTQRIMVVVV